MKRYILLLMMFSVSLFLAACTQQDEVAVLHRRIAMQDQELQRINRQVSGAQPAQADTWAQVQALRQEMATMRGDLDNFKNATITVGGLEGLAAQVSKHQRALQSVETQFGMDLKLQDAAGMPPLVLNTPAKTTHPAVRTPVAVAPVPVVVKAAGDTPTTLYDTGITSFNARKYEQAFNAFRDFTDTYADNKLIANAWFWRGESNYQMNKYAAAALDYEMVISKYPTSAKLPSAYLKQGMSFFKTGKKEAARFRLDELLKKFPQSPEAQRAKNVLKENP